MQLACVLELKGRTGIGFAALLIHAIPHVAGDILSTCNQNQQRLQRLTVVRACPFFTTPIIALSLSGPRGTPRLSQPPSPQISNRPTPFMRFQRVRTIRATTTTTQLSQVPFFNTPLTRWNGARLQIAEATVSSASLTFPQLDELRI